MQMGAGNRSRQRYSYFLIAGDGRKGISFAPEIRVDQFIHRERQKNKKRNKTPNKKREGIQQQIAGRISLLTCVSMANRII
jgi:hypothetical protein